MIWNAAVTAVFSAFCLLCLFPGRGIPAWWGAAVVPLYAGTLAVFGRIYGVRFLIGAGRRILFIRYFLTLLLSDALWYVIGLFAALYDPRPLLLCAGVQTAVSLPVLLAGGSYLRHRYPPLRVLLLSPEGEELCAFPGQNEIRKGYDRSEQRLCRELTSGLLLPSAYDLVLIGDTDEAEAETLLALCREAGTPAEAIPGIPEMIRRRCGNGTGEGYYRPTRFYLFVKRAADIVISLLALLLLLPLFLVLSLWIRLYDGGPVFYRQERMTQGGKRFRIRKFRSMRTDAEGDGIARLSTGANDPRITAPGRFMRRFHLDELPQLIDILAGDLSVVGPRPERPGIAAEYEKTLPEFRLRLQAKAGLTGYAQVYGKYNTDPCSKLRMDLIYMERAGLFLDFSLCLATVMTVFTPDNTEGVAEGSTNAMR